VLRVVAAGAVAALALAGCTSGSGEAGPTTQPTDTPSVAASTPAVTPSPTPTATKTAAAAKGAPKRPAGMNANTAEGARKTALYFNQLYPYIMTTGDLRAFDQLSVKKECDFCAKARAQAVKIKREHLTFAGGSIKSKVLTTYDRDTLYDGYPLDVQMVQQAFSIRDKGSVVHAEPAKTFMATVEVVRAGHGWKILEVSTRNSSK
jgi:hypothetical protein